MRGEVGWRGLAEAPRGLAGPNEDFAANAKQLSDLARSALAAKNAGDDAQFQFFMQQYRTLNGQLAPVQQQAVKAALAKEMPSAFMMELAGYGDWFASVFRSLPLTLLVVAGLYVFILKGATRGMRD